TARLLHLARIDGMAARLERDEPTPVLELSKAAEPAPRRLRANLRTARRRAERLGSLSFERANGDNLDASFDAYCRLHAARWHERGKDGALPDAAAAFQREVATAFQRRGWLRLHLMHLDG